MHSHSRGFIPVIVILALGLLVVGSGLGAYEYHAHARAQAEKEKQDESAREADAQKLQMLEDQLARLDARGSATSSAGTSSGEEAQVLKKQLENLKAKYASPAAIPQIPHVIASSAPKTVEALPIDQESTTQLIERVKQSVYSLSARSTKGSGFAVASNLILTNNHVVDGVFGVTIGQSNAADRFGYVVARDTNADLALVEVDGPALVPLELGSSAESDLKTGSQVFAFGFPFGIGSDVSVKDGIVSRRVTIEKKDYVEISNSIHSGNSGGPLINARGKVVGVNAALYGDSVSGVQVGETIKLAIPSSIVSTTLDALRAKQVTLSSQKKGDIKKLEAFLTGFEQLVVDLGIASADYTNGADTALKGNVEDGKVSVVKAESAFSDIGLRATSLRNTNPDLPNKADLDTLLNLAKRVSSDMNDISPLTDRMLSSGTGEAMYSVYTDVVQRYAIVLTNISNVSLGYKDYQAKMAVYFGIQ